MVLTAKKIDKILVFKSINKFWYGKKIMKNQWIWSVNQPPRPQKQLAIH